MTTRPVHVTTPLDARARPEARAWIVLGILCFVYVINFLDRQLLSILAKPIQDDLGVTDGQIGLISGLYFALFYCVLAIPVGWFADRVNRVLVVSIACALWSAATMACGMAASYPQLAIARMGVGVGEAGGVPPVGGAAAAVQQTGRAEDEGAAADGEHPGAALGGRAQGVDQRRRVLVPDGGRRGDHQVGLGEPLDAVRDVDAEARVGAQRARPVGGDREVVHREALLAPVQAEHLAGHAQFEGMDLFQHHGHDVLQHAVQDADGPGRAP
jgi:hypothetical protein